MVPFLWSTIGVGYEQHAYLWTGDRVDFERRRSAIASPTKRKFATRRS
ncbi:MAG: hypothetical protein ACLP50_27150 [Solirubrobacteraceae bacterium]